MPLLMELGETEMNFVINMSRLAALSRFSAVTLLSSTSLARSARGLLTKIVRFAPNESVVYKRFDFTRFK